jgi:hypothetical protein
VKTPGTEADGPTLPGGRGIARGKIQDDIMRVLSAEPLRERGAANGKEELTLQPYLRCS